MIRLATVVEHFEPVLRHQYGHQLLPSHQRALDAIRACRSALSKKMLLRCQDCSEQHVIPHSCGHRSCPHCQHHESQQWIEKQHSRSVPAEYFMVTFTLPKPLRTLAWEHQRAVYDAMIKAAWDTLRSFAARDRALQGTPGAIAVLHTHSRRLDYHPHVHMVVPAAAVDEKHSRWRTKASPGKARYLFSHKALAKVFRGKLLAAFSALGLQTPASIPKQWVVDCSHVGNGEKALVYLGRYLYRGVISERDILSCENGVVTFRYRDSRSKTTKTRSMPGVDFLWAVLRHVLPRGFQRSRNFGILHPARKKLIRLLEVLLKIYRPDPPDRNARPGYRCPCCGGAMRIAQRGLEPAFVPSAAAPLSAAAAPVM